MLGLVISGPVAADVIGFTDGFAPGTWTVNFTGPNVVAPTSNDILGSPCGSAFNISGARVVGGEKWMNTLRFDVEGKPAEDRQPPIADELFEHLQSSLRSRPVDFASCANLGVVAHPAQ